jgi:alanine racemase
MRAPSTEAGSQRPAAAAFSSDRPTVAVVSLDALDHNYNAVVRLAQGRRVLPVVKAGAYGHGAVEISRRLLTLGADTLGVALIEEGGELRDAGIDAPILVMGATFPEQAEAMVSLKLTPVVYSTSGARALSEAARKHNTTINVHVKIDTGMGRLGITPEEAPELIDSFRKLGTLSVQGLMTHFADADLQDKAFASRQMDRFDGLLKALEAKNIQVPERHVANSAAVLAFPRAFFTLVRPGLMLYGYNPLEEVNGNADLRPVLSLVTRIAFIKKVPSGTTISYGRTFTTKRESVIATLPLGYADGYARGLSNKGEALVRGARVPLVGRVCMDMCMIDVTDVPAVREGDEVVLIGGQGNERITADDIAAKTGTIAYEVLCGISSRVPRLYQ